MYMIPYRNWEMGVLFTCPHFFDGSAHAHVSGEGKVTRIGTDLKPLTKKDASLSPKQAKVVKKYSRKIGKALGTIKKWLKLSK